MKDINDKKIRYVSIDPSQFLFDEEFMSLNYHDKGFFLILIFFMIIKDGQLPSDMKKLSKLTGIKKVSEWFPKVSHLFIIRDSTITHPLVSSALLRARQISELQSSKGTKSAMARGYESEETNPVEPSEAKRTEEKIREVKKSEEKLSEEKTRAQFGDVSRGFYNTEKSKVSGISSIGSVLANSSSLMPRSASPSTVDVTMMQIKFYDQLCRIFSKRTPADTSSLHNLTSWVRQQVAQGRFTAEIFERILDIARQSVQGRPRKPLAVFYSQLKSELGYRCIESAVS